jgi:hypothetical protein
MEVAVKQKNGLVSLIATLPDDYEKRIANNWGMSIKYKFLNIDSVQGEVSAYIHTKTEYNKFISGKWNVRVSSFDREMKQVRYCLDYSSYDPKQNPVDFNAANQKYLKTLTDDVEWCKEDIESALKEVKSAENVLKQAEHKLTLFKEAIPC